MFLSVGTLKKYMVKVYTKTGDRGTSSLYNGSVRSKTDPYFEALGSVDELQSHLGLLIYKLTLLSRESLADVQELLQTIQTRLMDIGTSIATPSGSRYEVTRFSSSEAELERMIDVLTAPLLPLRNFILPGGSEPAALSHICRSVCRRAERHVLLIPNPDPSVVIYLNRLSDFFFTLARWFNFQQDSPDIVYQMKKGCSTPSLSPSESKQ
jgi:cob(I)alamin adenosyltransferase